MDGVVQEKLLIKLIHIRTTWAFIEQRKINQLIKNQTQRWERGGAVDLDPHKKLDRLYLNLVRYAGSVSGSQVHCTPFFTDYSIGIKFINKFLKSEAFAKEKKVYR